MHFSLQHKAEARLQSATHKGMAAQNAFCHCKEKALHNKQHPPQKKKKKAQVQSIITSLKRMLVFPLI